MRHPLPPHAVRFKEVTFMFQLDSQDYKDLEKAFVKAVENHHGLIEKKLEELTASLTHNVFVALMPDPPYGTYAPSWKLASFSRVFNLVREEDSMVIWLWLEELWRRIDLAFERKFPIKANLIQENVPRLIHIFLHDCCQIDSITEEEIRREINASNTTVS